MPNHSPKSGFDLETELSPQTLQQLVSQIFESGLIEQTYLLDPVNDPSQQLIILLDPEAERDYSHHQDWQQPDLNEDQLDAFKVNCYHNEDHPGWLAIDVRLLIYFKAPPMNSGYRTSVEATFHLNEEISTQLLYLGAESYRTAYQDWELLPADEKTEANKPTFRWEQYLALAGLEYTDSDLELADLVNAVGKLQATGQCNRIEDEAAKAACLDEVESRSDNYYFDELLAGINQQIYASLETSVRDRRSGLGKFLDDNEDSLQLIQLGRIGLNALPGGALGLYLNTRQKTGFGTFMDDGSGSSRAGTSLRPYIIDLNEPGGMRFTEVPGFIGLASKKGYFERLIPDLIAKILAKINLDAGEIDEAGAKASLLGDALPIFIDKDTPGLDLPVNLKIKRIRVRAKEKKFRITEDGDKEKMTALEIRMDVNETAGEQFKLGGNNLMIYLVPHLVYDTEANTTALRCFVQTNMRVDFFSSIFTLGGPLGLLASAFAAMAGKKNQLSEDLGSLIGSQIPTALHPLRQRWDPLYEVGQGWLFDLATTAVHGDFGETYLLFTATTKANQKFLPIKGTTLRSALPFNVDGEFTLEQTETVKTDLLFRTPGQIGPSLLSPDLAPAFDEEGEEISFDQPVGNQSNPYFSFHQFPYEAVPEDEEGIFNRVWKIPLSEGASDLHSRIAYGCVLTPAIYFPVCALNGDGRILLLGLYSTQEFEDFKLTVYWEERDRLIDEAVELLLAPTGQTIDEVDPATLANLRSAAADSVDRGSALSAFYENIVSEAKERLPGYPGAVRLQLTPLTLADLITIGYAAFPGYTAVRQSSGEVYFRNVPNDIVSDNLEELRSCTQLHFPDELISAEE